MYDYLAKIILIGPSGSGKFVRTLFPRTILGLSCQVLPPASDSQERMLVCQRFSIRIH